MDKRVSWSKKDIAFLKNSIGKISYLEISEHLNKPVSAVASKIHKLGIAARNTKRWKNEELKFLVDNYNKIGVEKCAITLNKTKNSIWKKASLIGLTHNNDIQYELIKDISGPNSKKWVGCGEISGAFFYRLKTGANKRNLDFDITIEYIWGLFLQQSRKCALSGVDIQFSKKNIDKSNTTASLDRINSSKGYTIDNIQWIHKDLNKMKTNFKQEDFIQWCKIIAERHK